MCPRSLRPQYAYDPLADEWTQQASMGTARRAHASAAPAVGGKLYVFHGKDDASERLISTAEVYDPASDSWAQVTGLTSARSDFVAAAL